MIEADVRDIPNSNDQVLLSTTLTSNNLVDCNPETQSLGEQIKQAQQDRERRFLNAIKVKYPDASVTALGEGGEGSCYLVAVEGKEKITVKVQDIVLVDSNRIDRERIALKNLHHPNVCKYLSDHVDVENSVILTEYKYVQGGSLGTLIKSKVKVDILEGWLPIAQQALDALAACHAQNVIHRDIKPGNLIWDPAGRHLTLIDFGLATDPNMTCTAMFPATPKYQDWGAKLGRHTTQSDIYALGLTLYELLAGNIDADIINPPTGKPFLIPNDLRIYKDGKQINAPECLRDFLQKMISSGEKPGFESTYAALQALKVVSSQLQRSPTTHTAPAQSQSVASTAGAVSIRPGSTPPPSTVHQPASESIEHQNSSQSPFLDSASALEILKNGSFYRARAWLGDTEFGDGGIYSELEVTICLKNQEGGLQFFNFYRGFDLVDHERVKRAPLQNIHLDLGELQRQITGILGHGIWLTSVSAYAQPPQHVEWAYTPQQQPSPIVGDLYDSLVKQQQLFDQEQTRLKAWREQRFHWKDHLGSQSSISVDELADLFEVDDWDFRHYRIGRNPHSASVDKDGVVRITLRAEGMSEDSTVAIGRLMEVNGIRHLLPLEYITTSPEPSALQRIWQSARFALTTKATREQMAHSAQLMKEAPACFTLPLAEPNDRYLQTNRHSFWIALPPVSWAGLKEGTAPRGTFITIYLCKDGKLRVFDSWGNAHMLEQFTPTVFKIPPDAAAQTKSHGCRFIPPIEDRVVVDFCISRDFPPQFTGNLSSNFKVITYNNAPIAISKSP